MYTCGAGDEIYSEESGGPRLEEVNGGSEQEFVETGTGRIATGLRSA
jgi:hypothetical protein